MFKAEWNGRPQPAERPRARFSKDKKSYYMYNPPKYQSYQKELVSFFSQFSNDDNLLQLFDKSNLIYGLSIKLIFKLYSKGSNPFYGKRPDIDNLFKAVVDSLFMSECNRVEDGILVDEEGNPFLGKDGQPLKKYKQKIDDSRVIHTEILKLRADSKEEEGFSIIIRDVGREEIF